MRLSKHTLIAARIYVERCQNFVPQRPDAADGGFFFSTAEAGTKKADQEGDHFRSCGTTTADGILALLATAHPLTDPRVIAACRRLVSHHSNMDVPGSTGDAYRRWPRGLAFYYAASSPRALRAAWVNPGEAFDRGTQARSARGRLLVKPEESGEAVRGARASPWPRSGIDAALETGLNYSLLSSVN